MNSTRSRASNWTLHAIVALAFGLIPLGSPGLTRAAGNPIPAQGAVARALAVVIVNRSDLGNKRFTATGFIVGSDGKHSYLITAYHSLCDEDEENCLSRTSTIPGLVCSAAALPTPAADQLITVRLHTDPQTLMTACVENFGSLDPGNDLLLLRIDRPNQQRLSIARTVLPGWPVAAAGYAAGILESMHYQPGPPEWPPGTVTWVDTDDPNKDSPHQLRDGVATSEGDSGGPLFDMNQGAVVGVVRGQSVVNGHLENAFVAVGPGSLAQICNVPEVHPLISFVTLDLTPASGPRGSAQNTIVGGIRASGTTANQAAPARLTLPQVPKSIGAMYALPAGTDPPSLYERAQYELDMGDMPAAFSDVQRSANAGYAPAQAALGEAYYFGMGTPIDVDQALHWVTLSANAGDYGGERRLGDYYYSKDDAQSAIKWYRAAYASLQKAAASGDARAQYWLGIFVNSDEYGQKQDLAASMKWFEQAAPKESDALLDIGWAYFYGRGVPKNAQRAVDLFLQAANRGNTDGALAIAYVCENTPGQKPDYTCAAQWTQLIADRNPEGANELGWLYEYGRGVPTDFAKSMKLFKHAVALGDQYAYDNLGSMYFYGRGVPRDYAQARQWVTTGAALGDDRAEFDLGYLYAYGLGVKEDDQTAIHWFELAADQDNTDAIDELADYYFGNGEKARKRSDSQQAQAAYTQAIDLFKRAASFDDPYALYSLGMIYGSGEGVAGRRNYAQALKYFNASIAQGAPLAKYQLGVMYERGLGIGKDPARAYQLYRQAAEAGVPEAQDRIGEAYAQLRPGEGIASVPKDYKTALSWFTLAAEQGDPDGLVDLGMLYLNGLGVNRDYVRAGAYLKLAISMDSEFHNVERAQVMAAMSQAMAHASSQQIQQFADEWKLARGTSDYEESQPGQ